jgi:hypothetical protein
VRDDGLTARRLVRGVFQLPPGGARRRDAAGRDAGGRDAGRRTGLSDDQVNLLCRTSLPPQRFSAELREWADPAATLRLSAEGSRPGPLLRAFGRLAEGDDPPEIDLTARLQVAMPGSYRIDAHGDPGRRPASTSCDGHQLWQVYRDRVVVWPAVARPLPIARVIDPAWLLSGYRLTVEGAAEYGRRPSLRLTAVPVSPADHWPWKGPLSGQLSIAGRIEAGFGARPGRSPGALPRAPPGWPANSASAG